MDTLTFVYATYINSTAEQVKTLLETGEAMPPIWKREGGQWKQVRFGEATMRR